MDREQAIELANAAHEMCPCSRAIRVNVPVESSVARELTRKEHTPCAPSRPFSYLRLVTLRKGFQMSTPRASKAGGQAPSPQPPARDKVIVITGARSACRQEPPTRADRNHESRRTADNR